MKKYVLGFLFSHGGEKVALIKKNKEDWQKGLLNGIGGKIEENESTGSAMFREFKEETGVELLDIQIAHFGIMKGKNWQVELFKMFSDDLLWKVKTNSDEGEVAIYNTMEVTGYMTGPNRISNLNWLIPMALELNLKNVSAEY